MRLISIKAGKTIHDDSTARNYTTQFPNPDSLSIDEVVNRLVTLTHGLAQFWSQAEGWAPIEAAQLLSKSRLDRQVSLSKCLAIWVKRSGAISDGELILAWANLGSLIEGVMKLFLSVYYQTYKQDVDAIRRKDKLQDPDGLQLEDLRQFFKKKIWSAEYDGWVNLIQSRRNAIHAYKDRAIGTHGELVDSVCKYLIILRYINYRLPYPDDEYRPLETIG